MNSSTVEVDLHFFKHLIECITVQGDMLSQSPEIRKIWRRKIGLTLDQCDVIIKEKEHQQLLEDTTYESFREPSLKDIEVSDIMLEYNNDIDV